MTPLLEEDYMSTVIAAILRRSYVELGGYRGTLEARDVMSENSRCNSTGKGATPNVAVRSSFPTIGSGCL